MEKVQPLFDKCVDGFLLTESAKTDHSHSVGTPSIRTHGVFRSSSGQRAPARRSAKANDLYEEGMPEVQVFVRYCGKTHCALALSFYFFLSPLLSRSDLANLYRAVVQSNYTYRRVTCLGGHSQCTFCRGYFLDFRACGSSTTARIWKLCMMDSSMHRGTQTGILCAPPEGLLTGKFGRQKRTKFARASPRQEKGALLHGSSSHSFPD